MGLPKRASERVKRVFQRLRRNKTPPATTKRNSYLAILPAQKNAQTAVRIELRRLATYLPGAATLHTQLLRAPHFYPSYKTVPHITGDLHTDQRLTRLSVDLHARMQRASEFRLHATAAPDLSKCRQLLTAARREEEHISTLKEKTQKLLMEKKPPVRSVPAFESHLEHNLLRVGVRTELERLSHYMPQLLRYEKKITPNNEGIPEFITGNKKVDNAFLKNIRQMENLKTQTLVLRAKASTMEPSAKQHQLLSRASIAEQKINTLKDQNHLIFWNFLATTPHYHG